MPEHLRGDERILLELQQVYRRSEIAPTVVQHVCTPLPERGAIKALEKSRSGEGPNVAPYPTMSCIREFIAEPARHNAERPDREPIQGNAGAQEDEEVVGKQEDEEQGQLSPTSRKAKPRNGVQ